MHLTKLGIKSKNIPLLYITTFIEGFEFFLPILALYYQQSVFTVTNIAILFSVKAICMVLFEIPTGAIADLFGRKNSILLDYIFSTIALFILFIGDSMTAFVFSSILFALGDSLGSGSFDALIYDSLKEEKKEAHFKKVSGIVHGLWPFGAAIGAIIGGHLAEYSLSLPILFTFIPYGIGFILTFFLKEPKYERNLKKNVFQQTSSALKTVKDSKQLMILILGSALLFSFSDSMYDLQPIFFKFKGVDITYFGYISAAIFGLASIGYFISHAVSEKIGDKPTLVISGFLEATFLIIATLIPHPFSVIFFIIAAIFYSTKNPISNNLINQEVSSEQRATVLSVLGLTNHISMAMLAPLLGFLVDLYNINIAFRITGLMMITVPIIFLFLKDAPPKKKT